MSPRMRHPNLHSRSEIFYLNILHLTNLPEPSKALIPSAKPMK